MARTITLRLSEDVYEAVRRHAEADHQSMNKWVEAVLDGEDMRRRCAAHDAWMRTSPQLADTALAFHRTNQQTLASHELPNLAGGVE